MGEDELKEMLDADSVNIMNPLTEGEVKTISDLQTDEDAVLDEEQTLISINNTAKEDSKVAKEDKMTFEDFKTLYKGLIDMKHEQEYPNAINNKSLWEDTARELFLQSKDYVLVESKNTSEIENTVFIDLDKLINIGLRSIEEETGLSCELQKIEGNNALVSVKGDNTNYRKFTNKFVN